MYPLPRILLILLLPHMLYEPLSFAPCLLSVVWAHYFSWSVLSPSHFHPADWTGSCIIPGLSCLPAASRQGGLRQQLRHGGQQVAGAEHGGSGGGLHVQVPHHPLCLDYTRAAQPRKPGEWDGKSITTGFIMDEQKDPDFLLYSVITVYNRILCSINRPLCTDRNNQGTNHCFVFMYRLIKRPRSNLILSLIFS